VVFELAKELFALLKRRLRPCLEGLLCRDDGIVHVLLGTDRDRPKLLPRRWVDTMVLVFSAACFAVDGVVELVPGYGGDFGRRHGVGYRGRLGIVIGNERVGMSIREGNGKWWGKCSMDDQGRTA